MLLSKLSIWKYRTEILKTNLPEKLGYVLESNLKLNLKPILIVENQLFQSLFRIEVAMLQTTFSIMLKDMIIQ